MECKRTQAVRVETMLRMENPLKTRMKGLALARLTYCKIRSFLLVLQMMWLIQIIKE